jgi:uncharacterized protein
MVSRDEALVFLQEAGCRNDVIEHCVGVAQIAVRIAGEFKDRGVDVNLKLVELGALLHDIGRSRTHSIQHAVVGAEIARGLGISSDVVRVIERHIGAGIPCDEAMEVGLPAGCYVPCTVEEKIVAYADKLVERGREVDFGVTLDWYVSVHGEESPVVQRMKSLHEEMVAVLDS